MAARPWTRGCARKVPRPSPIWPLPDVRVPVAVRPQLGGRVVDVEATEPVEADPLVDLAEGRVVGLRIGDVDARDPEMAGVEAEPQARVAVEPVDERRELVDRAADRAAGAG